MRAQQRALGLEEAPAGPEKEKPGKKRRRPRKRALRLIEELRQGQEAVAQTGG